MIRYTFNRVPFVDISILDDGTLWVDIFLSDADWDRLVEMLKRAKVEKYATYRKDLKRFLVDAGVGTNIPARVVIVGKRR